MKSESELFNQEPYSGDAEEESVSESESKNDSRLQQTMSFTVEVIVPRMHTRGGASFAPPVIGVYVRTRDAVYTVPVPSGLFPGDVFTFEPADENSIRPTERVSIPASVAPGATFKHRMTSGKQVLVSVPRLEKGRSRILVPCHESFTVHLPIQAAVDDLEEEEEDDFVVRARNRAEANTLEQNAARRRAELRKESRLRNEFQMENEEEALVKVLAATTLQANGLLPPSRTVGGVPPGSNAQTPSNDDIELQKAIQESLRFHGSQGSKPRPSHREDEDENLARVMAASRAEHMTQTVHRPLVSQQPSVVNAIPNDIMKEYMAALPEDIRSEFLSTETMQTKAFEEFAKAAQVGDRYPQPTQALSGHSLPTPAPSSYSLPTPAPHAPSSYPPPTPAPYAPSSYLPPKQSSFPTQAFPPPPRDSLASPYAPEFPSLGQALAPPPSAPRKLLPPAHVAPPTVAPLQPAQAVVNRPAVYTMTPEQRQHLTNIADRAMKDKHPSMRARYVETLGTKYEIGIAESILLKLEHTNLEKEQKLKNES